MATKYSAKGTILYFGSANPPSTQVLQIGDIELDLGERVGLADVTTHDNTTGVREKLDVGFKEPAKVSFDIVYDPADAVHEDMRLVELTYAVRYAKIVLPDAGTAQWVGSARVSSFNIGAPVADKLTAKVVLELLGAFTFTA